MKVILRKHAAKKISKVELQQRMAIANELLLDYLQERIGDQLARGVKSFSVDSLITAKDWYEKPFSSLVEDFKHREDKNQNVARNRIRVRAGYILRDAIAESGMKYTAGWYEKKSDPRGRARLYTLED